MGHGPRPTTGCEENIHMPAGTLHNTDLSDTYVMNRPHESGCAPLFTLTNRDTPEHSVNSPDVHGCGG
jgi:hypothetical protein